MVDPKRKLELPPETQKATKKAAPMDCEGRKKYINLNLLDTERFRYTDEKWALPLVSDPGWREAVLHVSSCPKHRCRYVWEVLLKRIDGSPAVLLALIRALQEEHDPTKVVE